MTGEPRNLTVPRGARSVWDQPRLSSIVAGRDRDRWVTAAWGVTVAVLGARRRGFAGGLLASLGGIAALRAAAGYHDLAVARDWLDRCLQDAGWRPHDVVNETSEDSFPASDPPQWTASTVTTERG